MRGSIMSEEKINDITLEEDNTYGNEIDIFEDSKGDSFVRLSDKYEDIKSSSYTMLFVGLVGIILLTLVVTKVINLPINNTTSIPLFYIVLGAAFTMFVVGGIISFIHSKKVFIDAQAEDELIDNISEYANANITTAQLDEGLDLSQPEEILYFSRFEKIKNNLMLQFETADEGLIDYMSENIYHNLYEADATDNTDITND